MISNGLSPLRVICELDGRSSTLGQFPQPLSLSQLSASLRSVYGRQLKVQFTMPCGSVQPIRSQQDLNTIVTIAADHYEQEAGTLRLRLQPESPDATTSPESQPRRPPSFLLPEYPISVQRRERSTSERRNSRSSRLSDAGVSEDGAVQKEQLAPFPGTPAARDSTRLRTTRTEIRLLRAIEHRRIVKYFDCRREPNRLCIFMEFMPENSLRHYIRARGPLNEKAAMRFTRMVMEGLHFLHSRDIIHRDVKAANILKDSHGKVKLSDFGAAKRIQEIGTSHSVTGTVFYMSPEMIGGEAHIDFKTDIWSLGATVVEFLTGQPPYHHCDNPAAVVLCIMNHPEHFRMPAEASDVARDFIRTCFARPASLRPGAEELLRNHPFLPPLDDSPPF
uniref:Protein kinase domain-containing protein n=1 Tax=Macrostomum lignano TaxID=282301 RepID=A0A1I8IUZ2_9PLAT